MRFEKNDLIFVPFLNDADLTREAFEILESANVNANRFLTTKAEFEEEMKYANHWRYLWILCHGGDGTTNLYGTGGDASISCARLAETLIDLGYGGRPDILLWSCYGGKAGGAAQALWLDLKRTFPRARVGGVKGLTGMVKPGGAQLLSKATYNFRHGAKGDESIRTFATDEDFLFYPGAPTRSFEV